MKQSTSPSPQSIWPALALFFGTLLLYSPVVRHDFVNYDDPAYVTENPHVQKGITREGLAWAFGELHGEKTYWHPVTWLSHMVDCQLFGLQPGWHHIVNVLFHALNALLLFRLLRNMTGKLWPSWIVAALFAVHPLQVDTVAWVTERKNVLSTMFWMFTLIAYVRYVRASTHNWRWYGFALIAFALGLMSKPMVVTLPCAMLLLDFWPLNRRSEGMSRLLLEKIPFFVLAVAISWVTMEAHVGLGITQRGHGLPVLLRIENAVVSYARYFDKTIWPAKLSVLYPHPGEWPEWRVGLSAVLLVALTFLAAWNWRRRAYLAVGWCWFLGVLVPAIGILQIGVQAMADRFAYVPVIGLFIAVVWAGAEIFSSPAVRRWLAAGAIGACAIVASIQLTHWRNSETLYKHTLAVTKNNFVIENNLGFTLAQAGRVDEAIPHFMEAARIRPEWATPTLQLADAYASKAQWTAAAMHYEKVLQLESQSFGALKGIAAAHLQLGNTNAAISSYERLLENYPTAPMHALVGSLLSQTGRTAEAIDHHRAALRLAPKTPEILNNLAWIFATDPDAKLRNGVEAVQLARRACDLNGHPMFIGTLAAAYAEAGRFDDAANTAEEAAKIADALGQSSLAAKNRELLNLYRARMPFRERAR